MGPTAAARSSPVVGSARIRHGLNGWWELNYADCVTFHGMHDSASAWRKAIAPPPTLLFEFDSNSYIDTYLLTRISTRKAAPRGPPNNNYRGQGGGAPPRDDSRGRWGGRGGEGSGRPSIDNDNYGREGGWDNRRTEVNSSWLDRPETNINVH